MINRPTPRYAVVRDVPDLFDRCIRPEDSTGPIDVRLARNQHQKYCKILEDLGLKILRVLPDNRYPDCCFVEDPAIVVGRQAIITRMGAPSRLGEEAAVRRVLSKHLAVSEIEAPATLDGGDVLVVGSTVYIGISERTNWKGQLAVRDLVAESGYNTVPVEVNDVLHLKSACSSLGDDSVVFVSGRVDESVFTNDSRHLVEVPPDEAYAANCLDINGTVLISEGYPETKKRVEETGRETIALDMSEFRKAGGSLTCLSIIF